MGADFITPHATKHKYNPTVKSTKNRSQFAENLDVKKLRENTIAMPDSVEKKFDQSGNHFATKYSKNYNFNISTADTPTGRHRVFINHLNPSKSTQFPYVPRN